MKIVFLGTPDFAVPSLEALERSSHEVVLVVTQPDRPKGRGRRTEPQPLKRRAIELGLKTVQPGRISSPEGIKLIKESGADAGVVTAFGEILSREFLESTPLGFFNVHASLLPKYRGAAPVPHAILAGESKTGVTIQKVVYEFDAGDIISQAKTNISLDDTSRTILNRLSLLGAEELVKALDLVESGEVKYISQDSAKATYAPKITKADARIDWSKDAAYLQRFIRAMSPAPGAYTIFKRDEQDMRLIIGASRVVDGSGTQGEIIESDKKLIVATGIDIDKKTSGQALEIILVKPEGRTMMRVDEFLRGYKLRQGDRFE